jgi:ABC-type Na+ efflux pump permease subunit
VKLMDKILAITRKELYRTFTDRNLLLLLLVIPLAIPTIVGLVFGGLGGGTGLSNIPVAVVNLDEGVTQLGRSVNYGDMLVGVLTGAQIGDSAGGAACPIEGESAAEGGSFGDTSLGELLNAQQVDDIAAARAGVQNGDYAALVVIPAEFSARLSPQVDPTGAIAPAGEPVTLEVLANSGQSIEGSIVRSIVEGFTNRLLTGTIAIGTSITTLIEENPTAALRLAAQATDDEVANLFACGFSGALTGINLDSQTVRDDAEPRSVTTAILVQVGAAQAVVFALFAGQFGVLSIIDERRSGTLQRMLVSPTPRNTIIIGKLFATIVIAIVQIGLLLLALTVIASLAEGRLVFIWGSNVLAIGAVILALALGVAGLGVLLMALAQTPEQVGPIGAVINIVMGAVGGGFGFPPVEPISYLSIVYWGTDAFGKLSLGSSDIGLNLLALLVAGGLLFGVGLYLFNRRIEI